jgi:hypothetical protein
MLTMLGALALAGTLNLAMSEPAAAQLSVRAGIVLTAPPAPREEVRIAAPRAGYIWTDGYWNWVGERHVWVPGRWMEPRAGYVWVPHAWAREGRGWRLHEGYWRREHRR